MNGCWGLSFFLSTARKDGRQKWVAAENHHQHHHHFFSQPASQPASHLPARFFIIMNHGSSSRHHTQFLFEFETSGITIQHSAGFGWENKLRQWICMRVSVWAQFHHFCVLLVFLHSVLSVFWIIVKSLVFFRFFPFGSFLWDSPSLSSSLGFFPSSSSSSPCALGFLLPISSPSISRGSAHSASKSF